MNECTKIVENDAEIEAHVKTNHKEIDKLEFKCSFCDNEFEVFSLLILHIKSSYKFSEQDTAVSTLKKVDGENNDVSTGNIEANTDLTDTVEDSGTENTISYEAFKEMLEDQFEKLSKNLSDGFTKFD